MLSDFNFKYCTFVVFQNLLDVSIAKGGGTRFASAPHPTSEGSYPEGSKTVRVGVRVPGTLSPFNSFKTHVLLTSIF